MSYIININQFIIVALFYFSCFVLIDTSIHIVTYHELIIHNILNILNHPPGWVIKSFFNEPSLRSNYVSFFFFFKGKLHSHLHALSIHPKSNPILSYTGRLETISGGSEHKIAHTLGTKTCLWTEKETRVTNGNPWSTGRTLLMQGLRQLKIVEVVKAWLIFLVVLYLHSIHNLVFLCVHHLRIIKTK